MPSDTLVHPRKIWQQLPRRLQKDIYGYGRNPAFWFTLNFPYQYLYEVHRFADAIHEVNTPTRETFLQDAPTQTTPPPKPVSETTPPEKPMSSPFVKVEVQHQVLDPVSRESHACREQ